jgi:hypothetical protein
MKSRDLIDQRLRTIHPRLYKRWNRKCENWEIWFHREGMSDYQVMRVQEESGAFRPIDNRTYNHLRYLLWFNRNVRKNLRAIIDQDNEKRAKRERKFEDDMYDRGVENFPVFNKMYRELGYGGKSRRPVAQGWSPT